MLMYSCGFFQVYFTHILQGYFISIVVVIWLLKCWALKDMDKTDPSQPTIKQEITNHQYMSWDVLDDTEYDISITKERKKCVLSQLVSYQSKESMKYFCWIILMILT